MATQPPNIPPYAIPFGPSANCTLDTCPLSVSVYTYRPNLAVNSAFITLFSLTGLTHLYIGYITRTWFFTGCMFIGCLSAVLGYIGRVLMYYNPFSFVAFMLQITCISTTPLYFCAAIYITLASTIQHLDPALARFNPKLLYCFFIPSDVFSLIVQAAGGGLSTESSGASQVGVDLALVGLSVQVFTILVFCGVFGDFLVRYFYGGKGRVVMKGVRGFLAGLVGAVWLIAGRCVYRVVELREGWSGVLVRDEWLFVGLEGVLVLVSVFCLMLGHPGFVFRQKGGQVETNASLNMQIPKRSQPGITLRGID